MDIERIEDFIGGLAEVSERYSSYKEVNPSEIEYHEPANEAQRKAASTCKNGAGPLIAIVGLGFLASGIFMMVNSTYFAMGIVICLISIGILIFAGRTIFSKPVTAECRAVWKQMRYTSRGSSGRRSRSYYVTVVFDHPEKLLCKLVQTTKADYEKIEEGTPVLLIKTGPIYSVRIAE